MRSALTLLVLIQIIIVLSCKTKGEVGQIDLLNKGHEKPNIVLFYADDLGWTDLGIQGSHFYQTPNIDKLGKESLRFSNAYANAPNCAPSRACLMTGLYTPRHGVYTVSPSARGKSINRKLIPIKNTSVLSPDFKILPQSLQEAGYKTCMAGKWHLSDDPKKYGFDQNFGGFKKGHPPSYFSPYKNPNLPDGPEGEYLPERLTSEVNNWLDKNHKEPFFLYYPFYLVHTPNQPKPELKEKYDQLPKGKYHVKPSYAAMIDAMDQAVGKVLKQLDALGVSENIIIIFTSDNGPMGANSVAKPLRGTKGMLYEGGIRVPFFIQWPGYQGENNVVSTPIIGSDIYPTIMDLIGHKTEHQNFDGLSFLDVLMGKEMMERPLFWHFPAYLEMSKNDRAFEEAHKKLFRATPCSVVRQGDWKLIRYYEDGDIELFNLFDDIRETTNLADFEHKKKRELLNILDSWLEETNAPVPGELNPEFSRED